MADDIQAFQEGRIAALKGKTRDRRRKADWLEGYDMEFRPPPQKLTAAMLNEAFREAMAKREGN